MPLLIFDPRLSTLLNPIRKYNSASFDVQGTSCFSMWTECVQCTACGEKEERELRGGEKVETGGDDIVIVALGDLREI